MPSFRQLIQIERLKWTEFKKEILTKKDKQAFDTIFENAKLYTQYLSNANRPVPIEPIMMGALFHNYKTLLKLSKEEDNVTEDSIKEELIGLERHKPLAKTLFDKTCERWRGLLYSLHKDDREQLLKMLVDCCNSLEGGEAKMIIDKDSESSISVFFFFCLVLWNQKLRNGIKDFTEKNAKTDLKLTDF
ncbi:MAG: hypothetical protein L0H53_03160 [Candidatus Nitrosocosmicus sp.]|nr:hypothetical protein [Candidatus Nitrosocosmicus sp.]MDN5867617.1 hypothetical protein [Candidatus Nitrosocosmicus sp.]